jgi:hypothetical protein
VTKVLETAELVTSGGMPSMLMQAPPDPALLETQEEFYDALMADNPEDDDDDENEEHGLVSKHKVGNQSYLLLLGSPMTSIGCFCT